MAVRAVFQAHGTEQDRVTISMIEFEWHPGFSIKQKQLSILALHSAAHKLGMPAIMEVSRKSTEEVGRKLSAFELSFTTKLKQNSYVVENAFQGSKVFAQGGPYRDLYSVSPMQAKKDTRLRSSGELLEFEFLGTKWNISPSTAFYDWLYINALSQNAELADSITQYSAFSDIEFNHLYSKNCQAHSIALFQSLRMTETNPDSLKKQDSFLSILNAYYQSKEYGKILQWGMAQSTQLSMEENA